MVASTRERMVIFGRWLKREGEGEEGRIVIRQPGKEGGRVKMVHCG